MKNKKIFWLLLIIILIIISIIIFKNVTKKINNGNNKNSQEIVDNILNLNSYKAKIYVEVISNKNKNKYIIEQEYNTENGCIQKIIEPENIAGVKITRKDGILKIENSSLNLNTIFENYQGLEDNCLDLICFLNEYKESHNSNFEEKDGIIVLKTVGENKYLKNKTLYIKNLKPIKLVIEDANQNVKINIEYKEIELN